MREWIEVPQVALPALRPPSRQPRVRMSLCVKSRSVVRTLLTVSIPPEVHTVLGWEKGVRLGLALGQGRTEGWVRLARHPLGRVVGFGGRPTFSGGRTMIGYFIAPLAWQGLVARSMACEHRIQGDALLIRIPWDMEALPSPAEGGDLAAAEQTAC